VRDWDNTRSLFHLQENNLITKSEILSAKNYFDVFKDGPDISKNVYQALLKFWHPDTCTDVAKPDALEVTTKLNVLYTEGKSHGFKAASAIHPCAIGSLLFTKNGIELESTEKYGMYTDRIINNLSLAGRYPSDKFKDEFTKYIPSARYTSKYKVELSFGRDVSAILPLSEVLRRHSGMVPPRHVGWIINSIVNVVCYLSTVKDMSHNGITNSNIFLDTKNHWALFVGGWEHSTTGSEKLLSLPRDLRSLSSSSNIDIDSICLLGLELLGYRSGAKLFMDPTIPDNMVRWLMSTGRSLAPVEFISKWSKLLKSCFGPSSFIEMDI